MSKKLNPDNININNDPEFEKAIQKAKEKSLQEKQEKEKDLDELRTSYQQAQTTGLYNYITEIDGKSLFFFCTVFLVVYNLIARFRFTTSSIVGIIASTLVIFYYIRFCKPIYEFL